jgi:hypothetical protein
LFNKEEMMKDVAKITLFLAVIAIPIIMASCATVAERKTEPAGSPPVITSCFASEKLSHGDIWRIYVEANDPDGDMRYFAYTIRTSGRGRRVDYVRIKKGDRATILGYLRVFTSPPGDPQAEWAHLTLTLHIQDRSGKASDTVTFPVALSRGVKQASPPPPFDIEGLKRLGQIWVELPRTPTGGP